MLDELITSGIMLADYNTFKICSPTRASILTGRYPWGAGFYDMNEDENHCTSNFTALPEMLKPLGYKTHALGSAPPSSTQSTPASALRLFVWPPSCTALAPIRLSVYSRSLLLRVKSGTSAL